MFHDDQHGTAITPSAGLLNACILTNRKMEDLRIVINGAGAAAIAGAKIYIHNTYQATMPCLCSHEPLCAFVKRQ